MRSSSVWFCGTEYGWVRLAELIVDIDAGYSPSTAQCNALPFKLRDHRFFITHRVEPRDIGARFPIEKGEEVDSVDLIHRCRKGEERIPVTKKAMQCGKGQVL